jgi:Ca-activated chloride channel family protein
MTRTHGRSLLVGAAFALILSMGISSALAVQGLPPQNTLSLPAQQQPSALPSEKAPAPQPETSLEVPSLKLRTQPGYEQVTVTVTDSSGKYVTGLKDDDFRVVEDGQQRPIGFFRVDRSAPVSIGIIVDCSNSMLSKMRQARTALTRMVQVLDLRDDIFLESFSNEAELIQPFTPVHSQIIDHLGFLHPQQQTALFDAIYMGLFEMRHAQRDKRALIVITDGMDNESTMTSEEVIATARAMKVLIYTIGIGEQGAGFLGSDSEEVDMATLKALSEETGARAFNLHVVGDGVDLARDCEAISNELTQQYTLAYLSPDPARPGYRSLRVDIPKHPELSVRVRKGVAIIPH